MYLSRYVLNLVYFRSMKTVRKKFVSNELEHDKWNIAEINCNAIE